MTKAQKLFNESQLSEYYSNILEMIEDEDNELSDNMHEIADGNVDIYYHDIYKSLPEMVDYIEQAREEGLIEGSETIDKQIQIGQYVYQLQEIQKEFDEIKSEYEECPECGECELVDKVKDTDGTNLIDIRQCPKCNYEEIK